jgi:translation initiation factor 3 subunit D
MLGGVQKIKFAFLQRAEEKANDAHKVVATHAVDTTSFCMQINLLMRNCWAIVEDVISTVIDYPEEKGEYVFLKEVSAQNYRLLRKAEAIDEDEEEYESEEEEEAAPEKK